MSNPAKIRERLGLTQAQLASLLRLGDNGRKTVERWEREGRAPGAAALALEALAAGWRPSGTVVSLHLVQTPPLRASMSDDQVIEAFAQLHGVTIRRGDTVRVFDGADCQEFLSTDRDLLANHLRQRVHA